MKWLEGRTNLVKISGSFELLRVQVFRVNRMLSKFEFLKVS